MLFCSAPHSLRARANTFGWRGRFAFALGLGKGLWWIHFEVTGTRTQISHDANTGRGAICCLKASDVRGKQCFEIVQIICAIVYQGSCETGVGSCDG